MIFGGPVLFARAEKGIECLEAFIHYPDDQIVRLSEAQMSKFRAQSSRPNTAPEPLDLPFTPMSAERHVTVDQAIAEHIFREQDQLEFQWGDGKKYGLVRRAPHKQQITTSVDPGTSKDPI